MAKDRIKFCVAGKHPLLYLSRDALIFSGYELIQADGSEDFILLGAEIHSSADWLSLQVELAGLANSNKPILLLSSSSVYSDRSHELALLSPSPMDEAQGHVVTSPLDPGAFRALAALSAEHQITQRTQGRTVILRTFNVYGPNITQGVIPSFIKSIQNNLPLFVHIPGIQTRTFLHEEDFLICFKVMVSKLLSGARGIFNLGSDEQVEVLSL